MPDNEDVRNELAANAASDAECNSKNINFSNFFNLRTGEINVKSLEPQEISGYLEKMSLIIAALTKLFEAPEKYSFEVPMQSAFDTRPQFCSFLKRLEFFFGALKRKFLLQHKGINTVSLSIDPTDSGFPHFTDLWNFSNDVKGADEQLKNIPSLDQIFNDAYDKIYKGIMPVREQLSYAKYNYFSYIKGKNIVREFEVEKPQLIGKKDEELLQKINFYGFDQRCNIFIFYSILATQNKNTSGTFLNELRDVIDSSTGKSELMSNKFISVLEECYKRDLYQIGTLLDTVDRDIHPKAILKYTVGPYYSNNTFNEENMQKLFELEPNDPFVFKFSVSGILSVKTVHEKSLMKQFMNSLFGNTNQRELFSDKFNYNYMITPFKIKQYLKDKDENNVPCKIFGMLDGGDLVE